MKISIVMSYYNRKELLINTLNSIKQTKEKKFEVIVVDDCSVDNQRIDDLENKFDFLKIIKLDLKNRWYVNPCIPFNIGINNANGDIIILQNPECLHVHDILYYVNNNITDNNYLTMSTYAINENITNNIIKYNLTDLIKTLPQQPSNGSPTLGWYNHSKYRPTYYHFCSAITKDNMNKLGGFDERYAYGISYDDNEILERINRLGLNKIIVDNISVIHQWHKSFFYSRKDFKKLHEINKNLFFNYTKKENKIKAN